MGLVVVISAISVWKEDIVVLWYGSLSIVLLILTYRYLHGIDEIDDTARLYWFYTILTRLDTSIRTNIHRIQHYTLETEITQLGLNAELGIQSFQLPNQFELPDAINSEVEMTRLEERASIILGSLVFIPILFALIHLFRSVSLGIFAIEFIIACNLGLLVLQTQEKKYSLDGWDVVYSYLVEHRIALLTNPRRLLTEHPPIKNMGLPQELGILPRPPVKLPSQRFLTLFIQFLIELTGETRELYYKEIIQAIRDLPNKQKLIDEKWQTYRSRVFMISITSTALGGLFSSLTVFSIPQLTAPGFQFATTPFLIWGEYLLTMILNTFVILKWYEPKRTLGYILLLSIIFFGFFTLNGLLI